MPKKAHFHNSSLKSICGTVLQHRPPLWCTIKEAGFRKINSGKATFRKFNFKQCPLIHLRNNYFPCSGGARKCEKKFAYQCLACKGLARFFEVGTEVPYCQCFFYHIKRHGLACKRLARFLKHI